MVNLIKYLINFTAQTWLAVTAAYLIAAGIEHVAMPDHYRQANRPAPTMQAEEQ
jgi:hypothetical protein